MPDGEHDGKGAVMADGSRYVTEEMLITAGARYAIAAVAAGGTNVYSISGIAAALEAVAGDIVAARTRECAAELQYLTTHTGFRQTCLEEVRELADRWDHDRFGETAGFGEQP